MAEYRAFRRVVDSPDTVCEHPHKVHTVPSASGRRLRVGDRLADRFVMVEVAASGGMGTVFRATDELTGAQVAVKVVITHTAEVSERFLREAHVLSELAHPAVVRYLAHGVTPEGEAYLAMEWLEGEDLATRVARAELSVDDTLALVIRAAEAIAAAHARGIVHRDIKPSNLFLVGGEPGRVKVLDFGVARVREAAQKLTGTGSILGTFGYMAPEQAEGARDVDARADVYALGCVLFECLAGRPVILGGRGALLSRTLLDAPPRIREIRPDLSADLDDLIARMLAKAPDARPEDAAALLRELSGVRGRQPGEPARAIATSAGSAPPIGHAELQLVSVLLARGEPGSSTAAGATGAERGFTSEHVRELVRRRMAEAVPLQTGTILVRPVAGRGGAADEAARAAACAVDLRAAYPDARIAICTGLAEVSGKLPAGEAVDRAAAMLHHPGRATTLLDELTADLVDGRFDVTDASGAWVLGAPRRDGEPRRGPGRATPTVGRDKELALMLAVLDQCVEERSPCALLITGPAGTGKSRLRHELLSRLATRGPARAVVVRADPGSAGSAFAIARQIMRQAVGASAEDPPVAVREILAHRVAARLDPGAAQLMVEFLAELLDCPIDGDPSPELSAARRDPGLLAGWQRRAFESWLELEASEPLVVAIEDLHWADLPTLTYLGNLLDAIDLPLMLLGVARPEVHKAFPKLWGGKVRELSLAGLGRQAAGQLVRAVLGEVDPATVERLVTCADGNALCLNELIRAVAAGRGDALPATVLAMAHARIDQLDPAVRRVLRAASVFGDRFRSSGIAALVGAGTGVARWLAVLEEHEIIARVGDPGAAGDAEYAFRHAVLREAAHATLPADDRAAAHRAAAAWLDRRP